MAHLNQSSGVLLLHPQCPYRRHGTPPALHENCLALKHLICLPPLSGTKRGLKHLGSLGLSELTGHRLGHAATKNALKDRGRLGSLSFADLFLHSEATCLHDARLAVVQ